MTILFANNATSRIAVAIGPTDSAIQVTAGEGGKFPSPSGGDLFFATIEDRRTGDIEIVTVLARIGDNFSVVRAQEGTTGKAFAVGATISNRLTAATINAIYSQDYYTKGEMDDRFINVTGDAMSGPLTVLDPTVGANPTTKTYVDTNLSGIYSVINTIQFKNDQQDVEIALRAPIASPVFTGDPRAPTPSPGDNDTSIATTAFVQNFASSLAALYVSKLGDTMAGPLALYGISTAPTPPVGEISTRIATTAYVQNEGYLKSADAAATYVPEAPTDGNQYARQNANWALVSGGGGGGGIGEAPIDGNTYGRKDGGWASVSASGGSQTGEWNFSTATGTPPASGQIRFNASTQDATTVVYISDSTSSGSDVGNLMNVLIKSGSRIYVQDRDDSTKWKYFQATADSIDQGSYHEVAVSLLSAGGDISNNAKSFLTNVASGSVGWSEITGKPSTFPPTLPIAQSGVTNLVSDLAAKAPLASPSFSGIPIAPTPATSDNSTQIATTGFVKAQGYADAASVAAALTTKADLASPTFTGDPKAPTPTTADNDTSIATTAYVKANLSSYAPLASPALTGTPTAPTAAVATNTTQVATTAFVKAQNYATLASPTLTGDPKAPTPAPGDNDTSIATTAFVAAAVANAGVTISDTAPAHSQGKLWIDSTNFNMYVSYNDGTSTQWVQVNSTGV